MLWGRSVRDSGSTRRQSGVDLGSIGSRCGVDVGRVRGRVGLGSLWGSMRRRSGVEHRGVDPWPELSVGPRPLAPDVEARRRPADALRQRQPMALRGSPRAPRLGAAAAAAGARGAPPAARGRRGRRAPRGAISVGRDGCDWRGAGRGGSAQASKDRGSTPDRPHVDASSTSIGHIRPGSPRCGMEGAWWRKTLRGVLWTASDPQRSRLDRGHGRLESEGGTTESNSTQKKAWAEKWTELEAGSSGVYFDAEDQQNSSHLDSCS